MPNKEDGSNLDKLMIQLFDEKEGYNLETLITQLSDEKEAPKLKILLEKLKELNKPQESDKMKKKYLKYKYKLKINLYIIFLNNKISKFYFTLIIILKI